MKKLVAARLEENELETAKLIGAGNVSDGIRKALQLAAKLAYFVCDRSLDKTPQPADTQAEPPQS